MRESDMNACSDENDMHACTDESDMQAAYAASDKISFVKISQNLQKQVKIFNFASSFVKICQNQQNLCLSKVACMHCTDESDMQAAYAASDMHAQMLAHNARAHTHTHTHTHTG
jgi:hypothetical protein